MPSTVLADDLSFPFMTREARLKGDISLYDVVGVAITVFAIVRLIIA
jgi:hypothetical protein